MYLCNVMLGTSDKHYSSAVGAALLGVQLQLSGSIKWTEQNSARKTWVGRNSRGKKFVELNSVVPRAERSGSDHLTGKGKRNEDLYHN